MEGADPEALVMRVAAAAAPRPEPEDETATTPPSGESVWGVTVEAPIVAKPTISRPTEPVRRTRLVEPPVEIPPETASESQAGSGTASAANRNTSITIMVVALVILAVSVFVLLRR
jgi:hypothetical protein